MNVDPTTTGISPFIPDIHNPGMILTQHHKSSFLQWKDIP